MRSLGRSEQAIEAELARAGSHFFPLRVRDLERLLSEGGFLDVELVWRAHGQAMLVARKGLA
jgi:hypothetical protein